MAEPVVTISISLSPELKGRLDTLALELRRSRSATIRLLLLLGFRERQRIEELAQALEKAAL